MSSTSNQGIINLTTNPILGGALLTMCALAQPARQSLSQGQIDDLRLATSKMTGAERRAFMAEMALKYCSGSARLAETVFSWGRETVEVLLDCPAARPASLPTSLSLIGSLIPVPSRNRASPPGVTLRSSIPCHPQTP